MDNESWKEQWMNRQKVEGFVRGTLGCSCPDEVFEKIALSPVSPLPGLPIDGSLEIGGRLLIYVSIEKEIPVLTQRLEHIVREGKHARDSRGFNRFRFVVVTAQAEATEAVLAPLFSSLPFVDDKVHLHIITHEGITALFQE
jgi:hypothetical protein